MRRLILGLVEGEAGDIERQRGSVDIEGEVIQTFNDGRLVDGKAVGTVTREVDDPIVAEDAIFTERVEQRERVLTEFLADLDADPAWVGVDSSDGDFLWTALGAQWRTNIVRAHIDVDAIARAVADRDGVSVWQEAHDRADGDRVGINYHDDAAVDPRTGGHTMLGFRGSWHGVFVEGVVAESGYVANWSDALDEALATWVREAILPHATIPDEERQTTLEGGA